jgi:hypothetical protein
MDANDVIVLASSNIRLGTGGASKIDSNSNDEFASAIAAGQLKVGQYIYVDAEVSDITFANATVVLTGAFTSGDTLLINDGNDIVTLTAGTDFEVGSDASTAADALAVGIATKRSVGTLDVKAVSDGVDTVTLYFLTNSSSAGVTEGTDAGGVITASATTAATASGARDFYKITAISDDELTVSPTPPTVASPGVVTVKGSMLRNPGAVDEITAQSFTLETGFNDVTKYFKQDGMRVGTFSLDVSTGAIVTGTMAFQGKETTPLTATELGDDGTYTLLETTATEVMNATTNVGGLSKNGVDLSSAIQSITLEGDASLRQQMAVGSKFARGIGTGRFNLTGTMTAYFETLELFNHFIDHDTLSLGFDFTDQDQNVYYFTIPAVKITSDPIAPTGIDEDVTEEMEWSALRDSSTACMIQVDRFSSIKPS